MIRVWVQGDPADVGALLACADCVPHTFRFGERPTATSARLRLVERETGALFTADRAHGVTLCTAGSAGISAYAGLPHGLYLLTSAMLGLIRWCALQRNPILEPEDFFHDTPATCLFSRHLFVSEYALLFERPQICLYCRHFYATLCTKREMETLEHVVACAARKTARGPIDYVREVSPPYVASPVYAWPYATGKYRELSCSPCAGQPQRAR